MAGKGTGSENFSPTMSVGGTTYAVSLFWQPLQSAANPLPEIRESAKTLVEGADLFCIRKSGAQQYALGSTSKGHKSGVPVAATILADMLSDRHSSLAVFKVKEGYWFVVIRNDLILSEEEILYKTEDDAKQAFIAMLAVPDWGRKIAPQEWGIDGASEVDLEKLFKSRKHRMVKLQRIDAGSKKFLFIVLALIALLGVGFYYAMGIIFPQEKKVTRVIKALPPPPDLKPGTQTIGQRQEPVIEYKEPWTSMKDPVTFMTTCQRQTNKMKEIFIPGFTLQGVSCDGQNATGTFRRHQGNNSWLRRIPFLPAIRNNPALKYQLSPDGSTFTGTLKLDYIPVRSSTPRLNQKDLSADLDDLFKTIKQPITFSRGVTSVEAKQRGGEVQVPGAPPPKPLIFNFNFTRFILSSPLDPSSWFKFVRTYYGLEVQKISYNMVSKAWTYEGVIYEKQ